jgi:hypothetical protein
MPKPLICALRGCKNKVKPDPMHSNKKYCCREHALLRNAQVVRKRGKERREKLGGYVDMDSHEDRSYYDEISLPIPHRSQKYV